LHEGTKIMKDKPRSMPQAQNLKEVTNKGGHSNIPIKKQRQDIAKNQTSKALLYIVCVSS